MMSLHNHIKLSLFVGQNSVGFSDGLLVQDKQAFDLYNLWVFEISNQIFMELLSTSGVWWKSNRNWMQPRKYVDQDDKLEEYNRLPTCFLTLHVSLQPYHRLITDVSAFCCFQSRLKLGKIPWFPRFLCYQKSYHPRQDCLWTSLLLHHLLATT